MRLARVNGPEVERYPNLMWYRKRRTLLTAMVVGAVGVAFVLMWPLWTALWRWLVPVIAAAFFYVTPFTSKNGHGFGLRSIPFLKVVLIPVLGAIVVAAIPMRLDAFNHAIWAIIAFALDACAVDSRAVHPVRHP